MSSVPDFVGLRALGLSAREFHTSRATDVGDVSEFCRKCRAFFELVAYESDAEQAARILLDSRPPGVGPEGKHVIGIERDGECVAIVDLFEGFPRKAEWYVGSLLLLPAERNRGVGRAVWYAMEAWMRSQEGHLVRLIVQEQNPDAARFWSSVGFEKKDQVEQILASRTNVCWRFEKRLTTPLPAMADDRT